MQEAEKRKIYTIAGIFAVLGVAIVLYKTRKKWVFTSIHKIQETLL